MGLLAELPPFNTELTLAAAFACMALVLVGGVVREGSALVGGLIRVVGNLGLMGSFSLTMLQLAHMTAPAGPLADANADVAQISGSETRIALGPDGHFWVRALVNGQSRRFLIDTGATFTTISEDLADAAHVAPAPDSRPVALRTANGMVQARLGRIERLEVGNVLARDTSAVIAPDLGGTNVLGMNFLSHLASWRVEGRILVLTPAASASAPAAH